MGAYSTGGWVSAPSPPRIDYPEVLAGAKQICSRALLPLSPSGHFSPLTFDSRASSGFLTLPRADTDTACTFFLLQDPTVGGHSGCPAFDISVRDMGAFRTHGSGTKRHGVTHCTIYDDTGGKLAAVTPSFYLAEMLGT